VPMVEQLDEAGISMINDLKNASGIEREIIIESMYDDCYIQHIPVIDIKAPRRIQDIGQEIFCMLFNDRYHEETLKNWFNQQWSHPIPVKCQGEGELKICDELCQECEGTGVEKYVSYVYDDSYKICDLNIDRTEFKWHNDLVMSFRNRPLEIIINPWVELPVLGT
jgi:hypothetical protein